MSILASLTRVWPFSSRSGSGRSSRRFIVDANGFAAGKRNGDRMSPRDQLDIVYRLSRFGTDEKVSLGVVFEGPALRKIGHGDDYKGTKVYFAKDTEASAKLLLKLAGKGVVLVTDNRDLEQKAASKGGQTMKVSTLKRALQPEDGSKSSSRSSSAGGNRRRSRRPRNNNRPRTNGGSEGGSRTRNQSSKPSEDSEGVSHLIDLVE